MSTKLKTGDLVLCKVGSFPPWPAVVFPQRYLRKDVYRKRKVNCVAVCFFNDATYYWEQPHRLEALDLNMINDFLTNDTKNSTKDLVGAYKEAKKFTTLRKFMIDRFKSEGRDDEMAANIQNEEPIEGEDPLLSREYYRNRGNSSNNNVPTKRSKLKSKITSSSNSLKKDDTTEDDLGSLMKHNNSDGLRNGRSAHNKLDRSRRVEIALLFRRKIQRNLIQRDVPPTPEGIAESHKLLNKIYENLDNHPAFFDILTLRESKLYKVLRVIINDTNLDEFHYICKKILEHWTVLIKQLKSEKELSKSQRLHGP